MNWRGSMKLSMVYWILAVLTTALSWWDQQGFTPGQTVIIIGFMILSRIEYHAERRSER